MNKRRVVGNAIAISVCIDRVDAVACSTNRLTVTTCTKWRRSATRTWWRAACRRCTTATLRRWRYSRSRFYAPSELTPCRTCRNSSSNCALDFTPVKRLPLSPNSGGSKNFEKRGGRQFISPVVIYRKCTQRTICLLHGKGRLLKF